ncbi:MAG: 5-(carboxyamino)imidazole ribonucleotide synthase [Acidimicrobiales bacterium]
MPETAADPTPHPPPTIGMVGGGQLARMTHQAAIALGIPFRVMVASPTDSAALVSPDTTAGDPHSAADLVAFATTCDVMTFDHELVDLDALNAIEASGAAVARPPATALTFATDKAHQRRRFAEAGLPLPRHHVTDDRSRVAAAAAELGWPVVAKTARGGYDGRGVWILHDQAALDVLLDEMGTPTPTLVLEECVPLERELAVVVARSPDGATAAYPVVETVQADGICRETIVPARIDPAVAAEAVRVAIAAADVVGAIGIIAVELFWDGGRVMINEVATRPHNSGHWTIEGSVTSQFANHLRAVAELPLGVTDATAPVAVMANILGHTDGRDPLDHLHTALAVPGAAVHLYGKGPRPGRKLGHVTVLADTVADARSRARAAVAALGDPVPDRP